MFIINAVYTLFFQITADERELVFEQAKTLRLLEEQSMLRMEQQQFEATMEARAKMLRSKAAEVEQQQQSGMCISVYVCVCMCVCVRVCVYVRVHVCMYAC